DVRLQVVAAVLKPVEFKNAKPTRDKFLHVYLKLTNFSALRRLEYRSWAEQAAPDGKLAPVLTDARGKAYAPQTFAFQEVVGRTPSGWLAFNVSLQDVLVFERPAAPEHLRLELPALPDMGSEPFRFQIPRSMIALR